MKHRLSFARIGFTCWYVLYYFLTAKNYLYFGWNSLLAVNFSNCCRTESPNRISCLLKIINLNLSSRLVQAFALAKDSGSTLHCFLSQRRLSCMSVVCSKYGHFNHLQSSITIIIVSLNSLFVFLNCFIQNNIKYYPAEDASLFQTNTANECIRPFISGPCAMK